MTALEQSPNTHHRLDGTPDERRHLRDPAIGFNLKNPVAGRVIDVSQWGLGIESPRPLNLGDRYPFSFAVGSLNAKVWGEIRWCKLVGTKALDSGDPAPIYRLGVEFVDS